MADQNKKITINPLYPLESIVYLITDPDKLKYIIVGYYVTPNGLQYNISHNGDESVHYVIELTDTKPVD